MVKTLEKLANTTHKTKSRRGIIYEMFQSWKRRACAVIHKHIGLYKITWTRKIPWY